MVTEAEIRQRALDQVALQFDPATRRVNQNLGILENTLQRDVQAQTGFADRGGQAIRSAYDILGNQLQQGVGLTSNIFGEGTQQVQGAFNRASQYNENALDRVLSEVNSNAERLGLSAAIPQVSQGLQENLAEIEAMNQAAGAASVGNIASLGTTMTGLAQRGVGQAQQEGANRQADLQSQVQSALAALQAQAAQARTGMLGELSGIEQDRGTAARVAVNEIVEREEEKARQNRLLALQEEMQRAQMTLDYERFNYSKYADERSHQLAVAQLEQEAELARANFENERQRLALSQNQFAFEQNQAQVDNAFRERQSAFENNLNSQQFKLAADQAFQDNLARQQELVTRINQAQADRRLEQQRLAQQAAADARDFNYRTSVDRLDNEYRNRTLAYQQEQDRIANDFRNRQLAQEYNLALRQLQARASGEGRAPSRAEYEALAQRYNQNWTNLAQQVGQDSTSILAQQYRPPAPRPTTGGGGLASVIRRWTGR